MVQRTTLILCVASLILIASAQKYCVAQNQTEADLAARRINSMLLITAAQTAHSTGRTADAGFYMLAFSARMRIDRAVYAPKGKGADSPGVLAAALKATMGAPIMEAVQGDPAAFKEAIDRLAAWKPEFPEKYDPGWKYEKKLEGEERAAVVKTEIEKMLAPVILKQRTLANEEYRGLLKVVADEDQVSKAHFEKTTGKNPQKATADELKALQASSVRRGAAVKRILQLEWELVPERRWHARVGWKAEDYFSDEKVIALCRAIEVSDVNEMEKLIASGADVNSIGKNGMTPLLWAYPDWQMERFECLLKHGANPNVHVTADMCPRAEAFRLTHRGSPSFEDRGCGEGESVTLLACRCLTTAYFNLVMEHGGDTNDVHTKTEETPLDRVVRRGMHDALDRTKVLVEKGANVNRFCEYRLAYPLVNAMKDDLYEVALYLIQHGADPSATRPSQLFYRPINVLARREAHLTDYLKDKPEHPIFALIAEFEKRGFSLEQARAENEERSK